MMTMNQIAAIAKEVMLRDGYHAPMLVVEGSRDSGIVQIKDVPADPDQKHLQMASIGYSIGKKPQLGELLRVFLISEAWVSMADNGKLPSARPSQDPARREVLIISSLATADRIVEVEVFHIARDPNGTVTGLTEFSPALDERPTAASPLLEAFLHGFTQARKRAA